MAKSKHRKLNKNKQIQRNREEFARVRAQLANNGQTTEQRIEALIANPNLAANLRRGLKKLGLWDPSENN